MTTFTRWTRLSLVTLGALALGACAQPGSPVGAGPSSTPANSGPVGTPSPGAPPPATGCQANLIVTVTDNGATLCVNLGGTVTAELQGAPDQMWRPITLTGNALTASTGTAPPIMGATTSRYTAAKAGSAGMSSTRPACPPAKPGSVSCNSLQYFHVTVIVR